MKIGAFAEVNNLTIDSVRHYMDLGLVLPVKQGGHYNFDDRCQQDIKDILKFKDMGFTLNEIKIIFQYKRLGKLTAYQEDEYYRGLFTNKLDNVNREIIALNRYKDNIELKLKELKAENKYEEYRMGVSLRVLDILCCPSCLGNLILVEGSVDNNQIMNGRLECKCGETYIIESGILRELTESTEDDFDYQEKYNKFLSEYIKLTDVSYLDNLNEELEWGYKKLNFSIFEEKILLELGTGFGYFLRYIYNDLPDECLYIAVDHNINTQRYLKRLMEKSGCKKNILFVCCDFLKIPIKNKVVDILLDFAGSSNYSFNNKGFLLDFTNKYVKDKSYLYGSYILFNNFSHNSVIGEAYRRNFVLRNIKDSIDQLNYRLINEKISEYIEKGGKYESYFVKGEKIFKYTYYGER